MNVTDAISRYANERPNDLALLTITERFDWFSLNDRVNAAAQFLHSNGVHAGQRVAISVKDQVLHLFVSLGLARLGATQIALPPVDPISKRTKLVDQLSILSIVVEDLQDGLDGVKAIEVSAESISKSSTAVDQKYFTTGDEAFLLLQSSGTTGNPKFSELTHKLASERFDRYKTYFETSYADIFLPLSRLDFSASKRRVYHSFQAGAAVCIVSGRSIDTSLIQFIDRSCVTIAWGTPSHMVQILNASEGTLSLPKLRVFGVAGATVTESLRREFKDQITPRLFVAYATNEVEVACLANPEIQERVADTVGSPVAGIAVEVVDADGNPLPEGQAGIIRISGKGVISRYLDDPVATAKSFKDGWFYPGDLGRYEAGSIVFLGRSDDMMIFDGMNIYPVEIENALMLHPGVSEVAALPLKHPRFQDIPVAAVILKTSVSTEELHVHCKAILGNKSPKFIMVLEEFPTNAMGKTLKSEIQSVFERALTSPDSARNLLQSRHNFVELEFKTPVHFNCIALEAWLTLLVDGGQYKKLEVFFQLKGEGSAWLHFVLTLATSLLQSLRFPIFDVPVVRSCAPEREGALKWKAVCERPSSEFVSPKVFEVVLKVTFKLANWCATADPKSSADREHFFKIIETDVRRTLAKAMPKGKSTFEVLRVAHSLNVPYFALPGGIYQVGMGSSGCRIDRSTTDQDSALGMRWTKSKILTAQLLRQGGLPAPRHVAVNSMEQAKKASEHIGFPLVVKPSDLERGEGVAVDVQAGNLEAAFSEAVKRSPSKTVLIEQQVSGVCHRLFVIDGELLYAVRRLPIGVYADGRSTIKALVDAECEVQMRLPPWKRSGIRPLDELAMQILRRQGWIADSVPKAGRFVALRRIETTAWGGVDEDVTNSIHPDNVKAGIEAAKLFGLQVAGVDIISQDITQPWHSNGAIINELNYAPLLGGGEISRSHIPTFLKTLVRDEGRIPIHVHFGGSEALESAQEEWKQMVESGLRASLVSAQQILLSDGQPYIMPLRGLYARCRALILSPDVDALIVLVQDDEFMHSGLPFDLVTVVRDAGGTPASHREKRPLDEQEAINLRRVLSSWVRGIEAYASEA